MDTLPPSLPADPNCEICTGRLLPFAAAEVFRGWTEAGSLSQWWGPTGFTTTFEVFEPRVGGRWHHVMHGPDGRNYVNRSFFRVVTPERIELTHVSEPHFDLIATFEARDGGTWITFLQRFTTPAVRDAVAAICKPANEQNLDRLTRVLRGEPADART